MIQTGVVIPIRGLNGGKSRLASRLDAGERAVLIASMANQVIHAVTESGIAGSIVVVSREADLLQQLRVGGNRIELLHQPAQSIGLNAAIGLGRRDALNRNAERLLVLSADLPLLTAASVARLAREEDATDVTLVTDRAGLGTNALMLRGDVAIPRFPFHFGQESRRFHQEAAAYLNVSYLERVIPEVALDLDTPDDWAMLDDEMRQRLLISTTTLHLATFGAIGTDPVAVLERA
ncbi:MAG: 2-phospho-L-lactate guanylyltransferase [Chloroflexota bacterium]|nr:2-phospho-L-lactate guanylyltransferase [Chloroflexota bacterium]